MLRIAVRGRAPGRLNRRLGGYDRGKGGDLRRVPRLKGVPEDPSTPIIWGQNAGYLYLQFRDFQKGARKDDRMTPIAQGLVKEDALALAEYFAAKPWPNTGAPAASKADDGHRDRDQQVDRLHQLSP